MGNTLKKTFASLSTGERRTFCLHLAYSLIEGIVLGVLALNEFVFIKSLHGSNYQLGFLFQFSMVVFVFLVLINEFIKRAKNKNRLLVWTGILTRLPFLLVFFFPHNQGAVLATPVYHYIFLVIFFVYYFGNTVIYPLTNLFLKNQYEHQNFGKLYGYASSANKIVMLVATFFYGTVLDINDFAFIYVFPVIAVLGMGSVYLLSLIRYDNPVLKTGKQKFFRSVKNSVFTMTGILKSNKPYAHFEIGFMFYGFSFMITVTVITIFFERQLHLNYSSVAFYKNAYNILAIVLLPFTGKLLGKIDPRKFAVITFASLALYILFVLLTEIFPAHMVIAGVDVYFTLILAYLFYGVFAATMALLWFIGSAYFCKREDAGDYQSVHLSLTGARALFAPLLGVLFYEMAGFRYTFLLAIVSLLAGIAIMFWSYRKDRKLNVK